MIAYLLFSFCIFLTFAFNGITLIQNSTYQVYLCLHAEGYSFSIEDVSDDSNVIHNAIQNLKNAIKVNMTTDIVLQLNVSTGINQVDTILNSIPSYYYGMIWVQVTNEFPQYDNCAFLKDVVKRIKNYGKKVGIRTDFYAWRMVMQNSCNQMGKQPLWYTNGDSQQNFNDFVSFGGWQQPTMKTYKIDRQDCNAMSIKVYY